MDAARFALDQPDGSSRGGGKARGVSFNSENTFVGGGGRKSSTALQITTIHTKARLPNYPGNSIVRRFKVPDDKVLWEVCGFIILIFCSYIYMRRIIYLQKCCCW